MVGNGGHGKTTLMACLTTQAGLLTDDTSTNFSANDTTGTLTSTTTILHHSLKGGDNSSTIDNSFEINMIDTPGHIDLIPHVTAALRIVDGALIVADCLQILSSSIQTEAVLRQALTEQIKPILVITKLDQAIVGMKLGKEDLYQRLCHLIDSINQIIKTNDSLPGDSTVSPVKGNVIFTCGLNGWGFSLDHFADLYACKFGVDKHSLLKKLWGDHFYDSQHKKWTRHSKNPLARQQQRGFSLLVLDPIYKILLLCNMDRVPTLLSKLNIQLMDDEMMGLEKEALVKLMMRRFLPCGTTLLDSICRCLPSPITAQAYRRLGLSSYDEGPLLSQGIRDCDSNAPLVFYISQMIPRPNGGFYLFGRVFSGTVRRGEKVRIMGPNSYSGFSSRSIPIVKPVINIVRVSGEGTSLVEIYSCPAGHLVGLGGLDSWAVPHGTISSAENGWAFMKAVKTSPPMVQVAVDVKEAGDLPKLVQGLNSLAKADLCVATSSSLSGQHYIAGTGHFHLDLCLKALENLYVKVPLKLGEPTVQYRETVTDRSSITCISKSPNKRNRLFMAAETMDEALSMAIEQDKIADFGDVRLRANHLADRYGWDVQHGRKIWCFGPDSSGANVLVDTTKAVQYVNEIKDACVVAFQWATKEGPLAEETMRGCRFNLMDLVSNTDAIHRGSGQIIPTCRRAIHGSMLSAQPGMQEPINLTQVQCQASSIQHIYRLLCNHRGTLLSEEQSCGVISVKAYLPVSESFAFAQHVPTLQCRFHHWELLQGDPFDPASQVNGIIRQLRIKKGLAHDLPSFDDYHIPMALRSLKSTRDLITHLSSGVGASQLPSSITKISLTYAFKGKNESAGAKHFLHETLPRLQYNNPSVLFELTKSAEPTTKPVVTVHFGEGKSTSIDVPRLHSDVIFEKLMEAKP